MTQQAHSLHDAVHDDLIVELKNHLESLTASPIEPDDDFFERGLINSLRALEIVVHVEQAYGVSVEVEDLDLDNFRTVRRIAEYVRRKRGERSSPTAEAVSK
ncbi:MULTISPECIES: acyl carrier protein [Streptomyces]|uniref:acyl carrier protein n=1 Tax=Streptomyces TaxID=1883 RepID=UPI0025B11BE2|nr:acyl carrier protein [Streptomyces flavofungini]WJV50746.1 acyl carrier protein [Streptomyces flavofungini]